ncbi:hypothetical protein PENSPDRAFT_607034 [Peniophora sp. CONT]|nr:hypothetical protein PENSPDRAFT_607034 [Peniophora sp. CONT]
MPPGILDPQPTGPVQTLTPTSSVLFYQAGPVNLTVTFLSPIEASTYRSLGDFVKQSIPASYVALDVQATDGASHSIQVYTDISAEWVTGDRTQSVKWSTNTSDSAIIHSVFAADQLPYREVGAQAAWGSIYYASPRTPNTTWRTGGHLDTRGQFVQNSTLDNTQDTVFRGITDNFPVFAFAQDLGNIQQTSAPLVWAVANIRDSASNGVVTYTDLSQQLRTRSLYYRSRYTDDGALLSDFLADFPAALNRSRALDKNLTQAATNVGGPQYADILALATRQAYCGIEITIGRNSDGSVNASDVMAFYKDTGIHDSGNGNAQVSPVDGLLSVFPAFLYLDPALSGALLEPLLRFQESPSYTNPYAALNMGAQYPSAVASGDPHSEGIETSSGMIIMAYGHAKATGDYSIIGHYFSLLETWAGFLTSNTLNASDQTSADSTIPVSGQTNLALKGIIAVQAMSHISALLNNSTRRDTYTSLAKDLYSQWTTKALASDRHLRFSYDAPDSSFSLGYNMFWDLALGTGLLNTTVIDAQTDYISKSILEFGAPTDSTNTSAVSANWNILAAAVATRDNSTQRALIGATHTLAASQPAGNTILGQFPLMYTAQDGTLISGRSSPRQGAVYAPLLINAASFPNSTNAAGGSPSGKDNRPGTPVGVIVGATIGAVAVLSLLAGLFFLVRRRKSSTIRVSLAQQADPSMREAILGDTSPIANAPGVTPFTVVDSSTPLPASTESSTSSRHWMTQEADTKRAYRLRRIPNEELHRRATMVNGPPATTTYPSTSPSATASDRSDPAFGQGLLHEINSLWREISAMRTNESMAAAPPPEYNA